MVSRKVFCGARRPLRAGIFLCDDDYAAAADDDDNDNLWRRLVPAVKTGWRWCYRTSNDDDENNEDDWFSGHAALVTAAAHHERPRSWRVTTFVTRAHRAMYSSCRRTTHLDNSITQSHFVVVASNSISRCTTTFILT